MEPKEIWLKTLRDSLPANYIELVRIILLKKGEPVPARWILNVMYGQREDRFGVIEAAQSITKPNSVNDKSSPFHILPEEMAHSQEESHPTQEKIP